MTVQAIPRRAGPYIGTGSVSVYSFGFKTLSETHLRVVQANEHGVESDLLLNSDYTVQLNADQDAMPGGTITLVNGPLLLNRRLTILSLHPYAQTTDVPTGGTWDEVNIENALDKLAIQVQQLDEIASRTVTSPPTSGIAPENLLDDIATAVDDTAQHAAQANASAVNAASSANAAAASATNAATSATAAANSAAEALAAASAANAINADGNYIVRDTRSEDTPTDLGQPGVKYEFKYNATDGLNDGGTYHAIMTFQPWHDYSGGNTHQLGFTVNGNLWLRTAPIGGTWGPWWKVYHSANLGAATESSAGIVELATAAETQAGTDNTRAVTPAGLAAAGATKLRTPRTLTIGNTGKSVDGSADVSWSLDEIGAARSVYLADNTDLNTVVSSGFYTLNVSHGNAPTGVDYGQLIVARGGLDTILQIVTGFDNGEIYWRQGSPPDVGGSGSWSPWYRFFHSGNLGGSLSTNGYQRLPGGLIIQWGTTGTIPADGSLSVTFPIAFPTNCVSVVAQQTYGSGGGGVAVPGWVVSSKSTTGFTVQNDHAAQVFYWIAIGY